MALGEGKPDLEGGKQSPVGQLPSPITLPPASPPPMTPLVAGQTWVGKYQEQSRQTFMGAEQLDQKIG